MKKYIAYGSNLNVEQMKRRCPGASVYDTGKLMGYRLEFKGHGSNGHLTITKTKNENNTIPVAIWEIDENDEKSLDRYEGYPVYYKKENIRVLSDLYGKIEGIAYIMSDGFDVQKPSATYLATCCIGYEDFGFKCGPLYRAVARTVKSKKSLKKDINK